MTKVIGLTGGMGSGKSTVSQVLAELGAVIVDADKIGHGVYQPNTDIWRQLVKTFGKQILAADNTIDRKKLGVIVFGNPESLKKLDNIVLPGMFQIAKRQIEEARKQGVKVVVLDAPTLFEAKWDPLVEEVWVVVADETSVIRRAMARTGLPEEQIRSRIRSQMSNEERMKRAKIVIHNDGTMEDLRIKVKELWGKLKV
ncbi:MAG: dephospho-CoA kinase [Dehalococcoidales bacterium]|nr:dephospho-CoA kinase [Dehalococcoidales bacterium]